MNEELLLKTAFCCMACDGEIAPDEIRQISEYIAVSNSFGNIDAQAHLNDYIVEINTRKSLFLIDFLKEIHDADLDDDEAIKVLDVAIKMIEADNVVEYSEISFIKKLRNQFSISDEVLNEKMPDKEDYFLPDIKAPDLYDWTSQFESINLQI